MNYEDLYLTLQSMEKTLKDQLASLQKLNKTILKETEQGDIRGLVKDLAAMEEISGQQTSLLAKLHSAVDSFDTKSYLESGDYAKQLLNFCQEKQIDVKGEYPVYEMFPYRVRFDTENQDIYLDRKKVPCMRPQSLAQTVKSGQERLNKAAFNPASFASELAEAYDLAVLKLNKSSDADIYLLSLYKFLAPMSRFRKDYDQQSFAFDLARLYSSDIEETKNGRHFQFGPSRNNKKAIRILDREGKEQYLATIRFF